MQSRKIKAKEVNPEELLIRKFQARCRFRSLGRLVLANLYWLIEGVEFYEGVDDVKRRVEQAVRAKATTDKQLLSIQDKAILNKPAEERTDSENHHIYRIIGGLKCFKRYPNYVKKKLAAVTYFKYYGPGRTIVRQHQEAHALYFVVSGDVTVSQLIWDELLQKYQSLDVGVIHQGDMFGEVSLLHNIKRTATCTTATHHILSPAHCELLALMKHDFKNVLQLSVQKQWDEVRRAMSSFTYFDDLDEVARREGCIVAKMKSYKVNEPILGDGAGISNFVYFVLSGRCQMIETLQVRVQNNCGREFYTLYDPFVEPPENTHDLRTQYLDSSKNKKTRRALSVESSNKRASNSEASVLRPKRQSQNKDSFNKIRFSQDVQLEYKADESKLENLSKERYPSTLTTATSSTKSSQLIFSDPLSSRDSLGCQIESPQLSVQPSTIRTYFMQVCEFNPGSTFGFGENMRDRRIIALTPVDCMLLPKIWLLQRNTANIWTRVQHYLERKIPTKKQLFKEFVSSRRWHQYRNMVVQDVVSRTTTINYTTLHDVPYSIRMEELID